MLIHPQFDPIAFSLGPLSVRWYGLMYLIAFVLFVVLGRLHARRRPELGWDAQMIDDLLLYGVIGVIVGGRLGEVLFFQPGYYLQHPGEILAVWKGGMSFHGGFLGVLVAMWLYGRRHGKGFWQVTDFIAPLVPTGLAAGRVGNFINGELWGRPVDGELPWAMVFPWVDAAPRHPSQLYQAAGEGLLLVVILWFYAASPRQTRAFSARWRWGSRPRSGCACRWWLSAGCCCWPAHGTPGAEAVAATRPRLRPSGHAARSAGRRARRPYRHRGLAPRSPPSNPQRAPRQGYSCPAPCA